MSLLVTKLTLRISADADNILELEMSLEPRISLIVTYTDIADYMLIEEAKKVNIVLPVYLRMLNVAPSSREEKTRK